MDQQIQQRPSEDNVSYITDWPKEPSVRTLKLDLEAARPSHDAQNQKIDHWNDLMNVQNSVKPKKVKGRSSVQPKLIRRQAEWRYSALSEPFLSTNKMFNVTPVSFEDVSGAVQNQLLINWQFRTKLNKVKLIDDYVRSVVDEGTSITKVGWLRETKKVKQQVPVWAYYPIQDQQSLMAFQQAMQLREENPRGFNEGDPALKAAVEFFDETQQPTVAVQTGTEEVEVDQVVVNQPTIDVLDPNNVYVDPSCNGDLNKALFVILAFETNKAELSKYPDRYSNLDRVDWKNNSPTTQTSYTTTTPQDFTFADELRSKVVAYEYWGYADINDDGSLVPIVATWIGDVMIRMELNPYPDEKLPFVLVPYLPKKRDLFGEPDAELLEDNQAILGATTRGIIDLLGRSANAQQGFAKGMLDPVNRKKYEDGKDYEFNQAQNPAQNMIQHKFPEIPQSAMQVLQMQNQEAESLTGVKAFAGGVSGNAYGDVAAGIRGALDAASKREMAILRRLAKGMTEIGTKIIAMNAAFLSETEVVRVTNDKFVTINREDLKGNYDLEVDISTAEVDDQKSSDLGFMIQTIGPVLEDPTVTTRLLSEIATLKRMPELAHYLLTWQPKPDPFKEQMQQLQLQQQQLENQKLQSEIEKNQALAAQARSNSDKTNLDFVEQESGTKHARDMEKQKGQAEGNQQLEVTKALLKTQKKPDGAETKPDVTAAIGYNALTNGDNLNNAGQSQPAQTNITPDVAAENPSQNIGSAQFQPQRDPALNPSIGI
ncbi:portal protein [Erwinia phage Kuerle]|nr:portal protein [Erwinia phage Kuerle]